MCGIAGLVRKDGIADKNLLANMLNQIARRGPDGDGMLLDKEFAIGMTRLAIIDLHGGDQPIFNEDRTVAVVCNGEIYNFRELRISLIEKGHRFSTKSDAEVIVHLYEEYGEDLAHHIDGMFAFAVFDKTKRSLLLVRDRLGIKPLFVAETENAVVFGSEIKSLLCDPGVDRAIDHQAVGEYLAYTFIPTPRTIYKNIRKLEPGCQIKINTSGIVNESRYWQLDSHIDNDLSLDEWSSEIEGLLSAASESHLVSDVPVGVFLSGGIDSSLIAALASNANSGDPLQSFTVNFSDSGGAFLDEGIYARQIAAQYNFRHTDIRVTPSVHDILPEITSAFDEPFADDSVIPTYYLCKETGKSVKVAMSGLGGDEIFGGYRRHLGFLLGARLQGRTASFLARIATPIIDRLPESSQSSHSVDHAKRFIRSVGKSDSDRYQDSMCSVATADVASLLSNDFRQGFDAAAARRCITSKIRPDSDQLNSILHADLATYLVDDVLTLTDRLSMWHSLEVRVPFLDHRLVERTMTMPGKLKISGRTQKYLLRKIAQAYVPKSVLSHKKQGFESPMARWLRGPLKPLLNELLNEDEIRKQGVFNYDVIRTLMEEHESFAAQRSKILFSLLMFQSWHRQAK